MKRIFIICFLLAVIVISAFKIYIYFVLERRSKISVRNIVKEFSFSSDSSLNEWNEKKLSQKGTKYTVTKHNGRNAVKAVSDDSASALFYKKRLSRNAKPFVSWDWKAEEFPSRRKKENLKKKNEFDFVAQVYVIFHSRFFLNAKAIQYVWTENIPVGTVTSSPYTKNVKILVLESGKSGEWKHEERDIKKDFEELFGMKIEKDISAIAFMTDSDSTNSTASAYYSNIVLGYLKKISDAELNASAGGMDYTKKTRGRVVEVKGDSGAEQPELIVEVEGEVVQQELRVTDHEPRF